MRFLACLCSFSVIFIVIFCLRGIIRKKSVLILITHSINPIGCFLSTDPLHCQLEKLSTANADYDRLNVFDPTVLQL